MIDGVFQQAQFDENLDDEITKKIAKEYLVDHKYDSSGHCGKCGRFTSGVYRIQELTFVCKYCLLEENFERRFNEERSKLG
jgi:hypothetical protein